MVLPIISTVFSVTTVMILPNHDKPTFSNTENSGTDFIIKHRCLPVYRKCHQLYVIQKYGCMLINYYFYFL